MGQILGMLESYDLAKMGPNSSDAWRLIGDASRLAFADRGRYIADSDFVSVPVKGLLDKKYLKNRSKLLNRKKALKTVSPGNPSFHTANSFADDESIELPSTSHISIVDQYGNALSMTTTIENAFGSRLMTKGGFLLNNEMTDFSFRAIRTGCQLQIGLNPASAPDHLWHQPLFSKTVSRIWSLALLVAAALLALLQRQSLLISIGA